MSRLSASFVCFEAGCGELARTDDRGFFRFVHVTEGLEDAENVVEPACADHCTHTKVPGRQVYERVSHADESI